MGLLKRALERLIRLCTGIERFLLHVYKWGFASAILCECGALDRTAAHVTLECTLHRSTRGYHGAEYIKLMKY